MSFAASPAPADPAQSGDPANQAPALFNRPPRILRTTFRKQQQDYESAVLAYKTSYQDALARTRRRLEPLERQQRRCHEENNPDLKALLQLAHGEQNRDGLPVAATRLWERRPTDADFLCLRIGRGDRSTSLTLKPPSVSTYSEDVEESLLLTEQFRMVRDVPLDVNLRAVGSLGIAGPSGRSFEVLQALLWQIAMHHAPSEVRIATRASTVSTG